MSDYNSRVAPKLFRVKVKECSMVYKEPVTCYISDLIPTTFSLAPSPPDIRATFIMCMIRLHLALVPPLIVTGLPPSLLQFNSVTFSVRSPRSPFVLFSPATTLALLTSLSCLIFLPITQLLTNNTFHLLIFSFLLQIECNLYKNRDFFLLLYLQWLEQCLIYNNSINIYLSSE